jgi:hypothetical protein
MIWRPGKEDRGMQVMDRRAFAVIGCAIAATTLVLAVSANGREPASTETRLSILPPEKELVIKSRLRPAMDPNAHATARIRIMRRQRIYNLKSCVKVRYRGLDEPPRALTFTDQRLPLSVEFSPPGSRGSGRVEGCTRGSTVGTNLLARIRDRIDDYRTYLLVSAGVASRGRARVAR